MKKLLLFLCVVSMFFLTAVASAATIAFEDMIETWGPFDSDTTFIPQSPLSFDYTHSIKDDIDLDEYNVTEAYLELDFTNDTTDKQINFFCLAWDFSEQASLYYDGNEWNIGEVDNGQYDLTLDVQWLNDDGELDVSLSVTNEYGTASAWLDHSRLYGTAKSVPEPSIIILALTCVLGLGINKRKNMFGKR